MSLPSLRAAWLPSLFAIVLASLTLAHPLRADAQLGAVTSATRDGDRVTLAVGQDRLYLRVCEAGMVKVDYQPGGQSTPETSCIARTSWAPVPAQFSLDSDPITITTAKMIVSISRSPCRVSVYDRAHRLLVQEQEVKGVAPGELNLTGAVGSHYYGIHGWEFLDKAGATEELIPADKPYRIDTGAEGNTGGPFLWSSKGFGVYVDTAGGQCRIDSAASFQFSNLSRPDVEYYLMVGNAYALHTALDHLTGMPPMFPKWALGLFNSEFAGITEPTFRSIIDGYRSRHIPFDTYVFDFDWKDWSGDNYGEWRWNPVKFPSGQSGMLKRDMDARGVKMVGIMKPRIHVETIQGRDASESGYWVKKPFYTDYFDHGTVGDLDYSIPACRQWFWDHATGAYDRGIVGWWNDEADAWGDTFAFMYMAESEYEGQRAYTDNRERVYTINRNFYSGSQRYAYATWSGDIDSGFGVMRDQRARLLASLNIGQEKWAMDTGGFNNDNHIAGETASECYARWMEFDAFVPIFRLHGTSRRQPWLYGPVAEAAATRAIRLRYSLIPYLYAYDRTLNQTGIGVCRPLVWDYPDDPSCVSDVDSWMFGDSLLVSPVVEQHQSMKPIYLPAGTWIDYFRGTVYQGGRTISYPVDPNTWSDIPLFVKSGAIIPTMPVMDYIGERPVKTITLDIFPSASGTSFTYYDDDGRSYNYEKGVYFSQVMTARGAPGGASFSIAPKTGTYAPALRDYLCKIHGCAGGGVSVNGFPAKHCSSLAAVSAAPAGTECWSAGHDVYGLVVWVKVPAGRALGIAVGS